MTTEELFWKCPSCSAVAILDADTPKDFEQECSECNEKHTPRYNQTYWEEFSAYCQRLKQEKL